MVVEDGSFGRIRVGNRSTCRPEVVYRDVGMNIDCRPREREGGAALDITLDSTSVVPPEHSQAATGNPVVRQQRINMMSVVTLGKPTLVSSMDDVESNRRYEIEVTATKVK